MQYQIDEAFKFYKQFILDYSQEKSEVYAKYGFTLQGSVGSKDWEVFAAILLNDRAKPGDGADLMHHEVKSAVTGSGFEYQYHKNHGLDKLKEDIEIDHVFIARSRDFTSIEVWRVESARIAPIFESWLPDLKQNYKDSTRQRFRRSVNYSFVSNSGDILLKIVDGNLQAV